MGEAMADAQVRVLGVSRVKPSPASAPAPHSGHVKLCSFDVPWVVLPPIQRLFLFDLDGDVAGQDFAAVLQRLKNSLAATLALYLPLAGKLAYVADTGDLVVDCSDASVAFVEAEAKDNGVLDVHRLAGDEAHDIPAFQSLVPELDARVLPAPVLSVQATRLGRAGLALGVSVHHAAADGRAVWRFMDAWASACRVGSPVTKALAAPSYCRNVIPHPRGDEAARDVLKMLAPKLPVAIPTSYDVNARFRLSRRTFAVGADVIQSLKQRIDELASAEAGGDASSPTKPVSTFVALTALGWTAFAHSKGLAAGDDTYLVFLADLRTRLDPPPGEGYFGNCVKGCLATADAGDLIGEAGLLRAARAVQAAVREMEAAAMAGMDDWIPRLMRIPLARLANVAASPRFRVYETDFGFGRPSRVELVSMNHDGEMVLVGGKRDGDVQVSVSLNPAHMDAFKAHILGL